MALLAKIRRIVISAVLLLLSWEILLPEARAYYISSSIYFSYWSPQTGSAGSGTEFDYSDYYAYGIVDSTLVFPGEQHTASTGCQGLWPGGSRQGTYLSYPSVGGIWTVTGQHYASDTTSPCRKYYLGESSASDYPWGYPYINYFTSTSYLVAPGTVVTLMFYYNQGTSANINGTDVSGMGSINVTINTTTTYTLTVNGSNGTATASSITSRHFSA